MSESMIDRIFGAICAAAKAAFCRPAYIALSHSEIMDLRLEAASSYLRPTGPELRGEEVLGLAIVVAGSSDHMQLRQAGEFGICLTADSSMGQGVGRQALEREKP